MSQTEILAAGAVVTRQGPQVLLVHRPRHKDWSLPKGKLDPGEQAREAAVREVAEETGVEVELLAPLSDQQYDVPAGPKRVHYWAARPVDGTGAAATSYQPNHEVDQVAWLDPDEARERLTYARDRATLDEAVAHLAETPRPGG